MSRIVYRREYNIGFFGLERLHPFDSRKYGRAYRALRRQFGRRLKQITIRPAAPVSHQTLRAVHSEAYLSRLRNSAYVAKALELPTLERLPIALIDRFVLRPMRWATQGTIVAMQQAFTHGLAINLGGGYHHAKPDAGEGFCIYSDIALAVHQARSEGLVSPQGRIASIDLDAHQGNGVCHASRDDVRVFLFDMFNSHIYPSSDHEARDRIDCGIPLPSGCRDEKYLDLLQHRLPGFLDSISRTQPIELAIYNAGTDVFTGDPLGQLGLSADGVLRRDLFVIQALHERNIPTVMLLSGGYTDTSYRLVADSMIRILETFGMDD